MADPTDSATRLAVLGSPIAHSKSPALHAAAYEVLGLPWSYERVECGQDEFAVFLANAGTAWRGLSLTMPLKERAFELADSVDATAAMTRAANTVLFMPAGAAAGHSAGASTGRGLAAFNTDVAGITHSLIDAGLAEPEHVWLLGAGATAHSALLAASELGTRRITVIARSPERAGPLVALAGRLGVAITVRDTPELIGSSDDQLPPALVVSTLPGGARAPWTFPDRVRKTAMLLDVAYDPWPSELAASWRNAGGRIVSGLDMLIHQALVQVRIFVSGDPGRALPDEAGILNAMRAAVPAD